MMEMEVKIRCMFCMCCSCGRKSWDFTWGFTKTFGEDWFWKSHSCGSSMFHERGIPRAEATNGMTESFEHCSPANFGWECSLSMMDMGLKNMLFFISLGSTSSYYTYRQLNMLKTWWLCWPRIIKHRILLLQLIGRVYLSWVDMGRGDAHSIVQVEGCMIFRICAGNFPPHHLHNISGHDTCGNIWKNLGVS